MDRRAARVRPPTSHPGKIEARRTQAGFTLLELVCVVAVMAILAAILVPRIPRGTSRPRLDAFAVDVAALLKADRSAAIRGRTRIAAVVDAPNRLVAAGSSDRVIRLPEDVRFDTLLPQRCNGQPAMSTISFFPTGMSCGGAVRLTRLGNGVEVRVNWLTGGIDIVDVATP